MERSPEVEALVHQFYDAMKRGDTAAVGGLIAENDATLFIGTDPNEWWEGPTQARATMTAQLEAMGGGIDLAGGQPRAYELGDMAWFADQPSFQLPDGTAVPTRLTSVAIREHGLWRVVQSHISLGVANEEAIGRDLPT